MGKRKTLHKPSYRERIRSRQTFWVALRQEWSLHFFVDVTTLIASIATVVTLVFLLNDRPVQANIAAWQILQSYLQQNPRPQFDEGQGFALETLVHNKVRLIGLDAHEIYLTGRDLQTIVAPGAFFHAADFYQLDLSNANFFRSDLSNATLDDCKCTGANFVRASLSGVEILEMLDGDYHNADFASADISDLDATTVRPGTFDRNAFEGSCFRDGHPPRLPPGIPIPIEPQSENCVRIWADENYCKPRAFASACWPQSK